MAYIYDVFLSYRHKPLDAAITRKAFHSLEGYRLPKTLVEKGFDGIHRVFRDMEELAVTNELSETIVNALHASRFLMVVCSLDAPFSEWVDREVATFAGLGREENIFALLISGSPEESFPKSLKNVKDIEERTLDVRTSEGLKKQLAGIQEAVLPLIARCAGCSAEALIREDKRRRNRQGTLRACAWSTLFVTVAGVSIGLWTMAEGYRKTAVSEQAATMGAMQSLTYNLPGELARLPGTYSRITTLLEENVQQINDILSIANNPDKVRREKAVNFEKLASAYAVMGDLDAAVNISRQAVAQYEVAYSKVPTNAVLLDYADGLNNLGNLLGESGLYLEAIREIDRALSLQGVLIKRDGSLNQAAQEVFAPFYHNRATNNARLGAYDQAIQDDMKSMEMLMAIRAQGLSRVDPALLLAYQNLGLLHGQLANYDMAVKYLRDAYDLAGVLYEASPDRMKLSDLAQAAASYAHGLNVAGKYSQAVPMFDEAIGYMRQLALDQENVVAQDALATALNNFGTMFNNAGYYDEADVRYRQSLSIREHIIGAETPLGQAMIARSCYNVAENLLDLSEPDEARVFYDRCLEIYAPVADALGAYHRAEYLSRAAFYEIIYGDRQEKALELAQEAMNLTPESSFAGYIYAYALMFSDQMDACIEAFEALAVRGGYEGVTVEEDFRMFRKLGLDHPMMPMVERLFQNGEQPL